MLEFHKKDLKTRARGIKVFPNKESLLRIASALLFDLDLGLLKTRFISSVNDNDSENLQIKRYADEAKMTETEIADRTERIITRMTGAQKVQHMGMLQNVEQMLLCYPEQEERLCKFFDEFEKCICADIDVKFILEIGMMLAGFPLIPLMQEEAKRLYEHEQKIAEFLNKNRFSDGWGSSDENMPHYVPDERVEFARIYVRRFLFRPKCSLDDLLRDYGVRLFGPSCQDRTLKMLRQRYYRFIRKFYRREEKDCDLTETSDPHKSIFTPLQIINEDTSATSLARISPHHHFNLLNPDIGYAYLVYKKSNNTYWLQVTSMILRAFKPSAQRCQKWIKKQEAEGIISAETQEKYRVLRSTKVSSPTFAAALVLGYNVSGGKVWRNQFGKTLQEVLKKERIEKMNAEKRKKARRKGGTSTSGNV